MSEIGTVSIMFEELKQMLKRLETSLTNKTNQEPSISTTNIQKITDHFCQSEEVILAKLEGIEQIQLAPKKVNHRLTVDIASSWVFLSMLGMGILIIVSFFFHYQQRETISRLSDNDLKYRYIKAFNKSDSTSIYKLEDIFGYNRNIDKIREIRKVTIQYEEDVKARAERLEQAKLKEEEARKLQSEANKLKKKM